MSLSEEDLAQIVEYVQGDIADRQMLYRIEERLASDDEFAAALDSFERASVLAGATRSPHAGAPPRRETRRANWRRPMWLAGAGLAAAAVVLVARFAFDTGVAPAGPIGIDVAARRDDLFEQTRSVEALGESFHVGVRAPLSTHVCVVQVDDRGVASLLILEPEKSEKSHVITDPRTDFGSYRLSWATADGERSAAGLVAIVAERALDIGALERFLEQRSPPIELSRLGADLELEFSVRTVWTML